MRVCSFQGSDGPLPGLVEGDMVVPLAASSSIDVIAGAPPVPAGDPLPLTSTVLAANAPKENAKWKQLVEMTKPAAQ